VNPNTGAALSMSAGAIVFTNEWVSANDINWRVAVATPLLGLFMYGVGKLSPPLAAGLGGAVLATVLVTPFNGTSPVKTLSNWSGSKPT
jgi:hypothetical protein